MGYGFFLLSVLWILTMGVPVSATETGHRLPPYQQYAEKAITFSGAGLAAEQTLTAGEIEEMGEGIFAGSYTMRTLVEPHDGMYTGIDLYWLLNNKLGMLPTAKSVQVICSDGVSMDFSLADIKKDDYGNETDSSRLKMILAFAKNGIPLVPGSSSDGYRREVGNDGGPLRLVVGQVKAGERNSPKWLQNVSAIIVSISDPAETFTDLGQFYAWAQPAIYSLAEKGVLSGVGDSKFAPEKNVTRAEFAKMILTALGIEKLKTSSDIFYDVQKTSWAAPYIEKAVVEGLIKGIGGGKFNPHGDINRNEIACLMVRAMQLQGAADEKKVTALEYKDWVRIPSWALGSVAICTERKLFDNIAIGYFNGTTPIKRSEAAVIIYRMLGLTDNRTNDIN